MSTRGLYGFIEGEKYVAEYNHSDSYPSYLGLNFFVSCKRGDFSEYKINSNYPTNDRISFIKDSLFCEWAYFYDKENRIFEIWKGLQTKPDVSNPFGVEYTDVSATARYYPCKRIIRVNIDDFDFMDFSRAYDNDTLDEFCKSLERDLKIDSIVNDTNS